MPWTVNVSAELPAAAEFGAIELSVGIASAVLGVERVNGDVFDVPSELETVIPVAPGNAAAVAGMAAVRCAALTKVVGCAAPFQFTTASLVKFVPFTVSVKPCVLQYGVEAAEVVDADSEAIAGGVPAVGLIINRTMFDIAEVVVL